MEYLKQREKRTGTRKKGGGSAIISGARIADWTRTYQDIHRKATEAESNLKKFLVDMNVKISSSADTSVDLITLAMNFRTLIKDGEIKKADLQKLLGDLRLQAEAEWKRLTTLEDELTQDLGSYEKSKSASTTSSRQSTPQLNAGCDLDQTRKLVLENETEEANRLISGAKNEIGDWCLKNGKAGTAFGGWSKKDHEVFNIILQTHRSKKKDLQMWYFEHLLKKTRSEIRLHLEWFRRACSVRHFCRSQKYQLSQFQETLMREQAIERQQNIFANLFQAEDQQEILNREQKRERLGRKLTTFNKERAAHSRAMEAEQRRISAEQAQECQKRKLYNEELRKQVRHYHEELERMKKTRDAETELLRIEKNQLLTRVSKYNKKRVKYRAATYEEKVKRFNEQESLRKEKEMEIIAQLERLRKTVTDTLVAERSKERLEGATISRLLYQHSKNDIKPRFTSGFGYTDDQLFKDRRFRVTQALISRGLHDTVYGRQKISTLRPNRLPRIETKHTKIFSQ